MVDVVLATTAAPTYLPAHPLRGLRLVDGGMWANNPTLVAIVEAVTTFGCPPAEISVLSLGTTIETARDRDDWTAEDCSPGAPRRSRWSCVGRAWPRTTTRRC